MKAMSKSKGRVALITGGAKRMGREFALALAADGVSVAITFQNSDRDARRTVAELTTMGVHGVAVHCDVRDPASVSTMIAEVRRELGGIDLLINNAGYYETVDFEKITPAHWDNMFAVNVRGPFLVIHAATKELRKRNGRIINIGSLGGMRPWASHAHYCASKAALHMLTLAAAKALAPEIAVNAIAPGMISMGEKRGLGQQKRIASKTPMKRPGSCADVVAAVRFFANAPHFITGQILAVDGGLGLT